MLALPLPKYAGLLGIEISPNRRFGSELADYARAFGVRGLVHSDESMEKYGFSDDEISELQMVGNAYLPAAAVAVTLPVAKESVMRFELIPTRPPA